MAKISPAELPDVQAATGEYGLWRTLAFFAVFGVLIAWMLWYLLKKLPRGPGGGD